MPPPPQKRSKNSLSLRLTESAVFLRTRPGRYLSDSTQPSVLRGLVVLDLVKPTRISSIELQLKAKSHTTWPEGFGARRMEVTEEHTLFHSSITYFRAGQDSIIRRPTSVGPGISLHNGHEDWDEYPHTPTLPGVSQPPTRSPSRQARRSSTDGYFHRPHVELYDEHHRRLPSYLESSTMTPPMTSRATSPASSALHLPLTPATPSSEHQRSRSTLPSVPELNARLLSEQSRGRRHDVVHDENHHHPDTRSPLHSLPPSSHRDNSQGHSRSRFSLASMSNAILDVMRPRQSGDEPISPRGRLLEKGNAPVADNGSWSRGRPLVKSVRDRSTVGMLVDILKPDHSEDSKKDGANWKEFKKGTYTYPISIPIPSDCPPTLRCDFGNVSWNLKTVVHRPGAFESKLIATREVIVVACPSDDDTEDTDNVVVERHWDQQLQYLIYISGRSFYIGGTIPVSLTLLPLAKVKIHRILIYIEERVDYYTQMRRIARTEPLSRIVLLSVKGETEDSHILPLESDDVDAFRKSPFYNLATPNDDLSEMASSLMGPGPWVFHQDLHLPHSCGYIHFTNKNRGSNIVITHVLKWVIRVERGDDTAINPKTGKRKLFDIVVQVPINILSCRCNPEWTALPGYSERLSDPHAVDPSCPCHHKRLEQPGVFRRLERAISTSSASSVEAEPVDGSTMRSLRQDVPTLMQVTSQYERLVSGRETETGETPPAYEA
ncbi:hypothetical protein F5887DRAFT_146677 [Amanita rubescens]|nr:hypothetical protein F5887DRAFT_146677 [Amanita rubescens]